MCDCVCECMCDIQYVCVTVCVSVCVTVCVSVYVTVCVSVCVTYSMMTTLVLWSFSRTTCLSGYHTVSILVFIGAKNDGGGGDNCSYNTCIARDIDTVESVQRRFTKRLPTFRNMSYNDRLRYVNIPSLELRCLHTDLFWCYKIVFRLVQVSFDDLFVFNPCQVRFGHAIHIVCMQIFFSERVINS